ncbi:hypothetical protein NC652_006181 [Populus alba x Populus x berolinensis]|nr:hypothetical protein NC652_006181 [Populus alba x Populus x berolinensis]
MASSVFSRATSILPSTTIRRRLPLVGAFCMISLGLSNLCPTTLSSSSLKTATNIRMEGNSDTVPSIVVYVTVPNREAGLCLFLCFVSLIYLLFCLLFVFPPLKGLIRCSILILIKHYPPHYLKNN